VPVYEYTCLDCKKRFEIVETLREHEAHGTVACPKCKKTHVERCWSTVYVETSKKS
jgi:putative FmdB family regulatory protein